jgi:hypothetical protein
MVSKTIRKKAINEPAAETSEAISLADEEAVKQVVVDSILSLWDAVNSLTRRRPSRRDRYRVTIFGSARLAPGNFAPARVRARVRRIRRRAGRHWHRARADDDLAASASASSARHPARPGGENVARVGRVGEGRDARGRSAARRRAGLEDPALRRRRRRSSRDHSRASRALATGAFEESPSALRVVAPCAIVQGMVGLLQALQRRRAGRRSVQAAASPGSSRRYCRRAARGRFSEPEHLPWPAPYWKPVS